ncbi:MAG TPA: outer membrane protein assembly factor BamE [Caulobacteraceae bacterium]|jgi:outer membrane protein assembly factor BamE (lipoprotein component of BamABCDE complex)|nr:outer membrane protein assembly factor BamE [Caulobacteraceae bacterium]HEX4097410.1 outer membrane protein assembly factor BamE [Caulobacteraceae bacterium]
MHRKAAFLAVAAGLVLGPAVLGACSPIVSYQGFQTIDQKPQDVKVGADTRSTVLSKLGSPTATSTFDKDVWFYISQLRSQTSFYVPKTIKRDVVAIAFDHDTEQVKSVNTFTLQDGRVIAYNTRETPTRGREMTVLEQLIGSIGAGSVLPPDQNITPGSHPGDQH